ncbi:MAG: M28 family peptidase [Undibacterium sp.]|nr:M28 family peptidase [Opitutaceae bacterium]
MRPLRLLLALAATAVSLSAATPPAISGASILARTKILASDEFEGRAPATPGEEKTVAYLEREFRRLGLAPGNPNGTYLQNVPMIGLTSQPTASFSVGGKTLTPTHLIDYVGLSRRITPRIDVKSSELVFVGYGVTAPEFGWDDYKGVDVRGKTVVMLINDPPVTDASGQLDPQVFGGKAMTYYGRWTYKYEIASAKGAAACLIIHETGPAGYPFAVVAGTWGRENFDLRTPDANASRVAFEAWLTQDFATKLLAAAGEDFAKLKAAAATRDFKPVTLKAHASFAVANKTRDVGSKNVVALLPGSDPKLRDDYVIYSAHWDHLGMDPKLSGDQIFNGAADNASGTALLLEVAQSFAALPAAEKPKRSILFLSVTGEEKGLLGSQYYGRAPLYPLTKTLANINVDGANPHGRTSDLIVIGNGASTIDAIGVAVAKEQGRTVLPDAQPEKGGYYRSDHFEFAKVGVPAYYPKPGRAFIGQPADYGQKLADAYTADDYHKVSDEVRPDWTFEGAAQDAAFILEVGRRIANSATWPEWNPGNEFKARRDTMLKK